MLFPLQRHFSTVLPAWWNVKVNPNKVALCMYECRSSSLVFIRCCPLSRDGGIHLIPSAITRTPSLHLSRSRVSSFFKSIFSVSSTCFFQVFFGHPRFLLPVTSRFGATLKTLSSSLLSTRPYHQTPCAVSNRFIISFKPNMSICYSVVFNFLTAQGSHDSSFRFI